MKKDFLLPAYRISLAATGRALLLLASLLAVAGVQEAPAAERPGATHYSLGVFAYEDGAYEASEVHLRRAVGLEPANAFYRQAHGKTLLRLGQSEEAGSELEAAFKLDPDLPELAADLAETRLAEGKYARAFELFDQAARQDPSDRLARYRAGLSLYRQERYGEAASHFLEAAEGSPSLAANARYYAGICRQREGRAEDALKLLWVAKDQAKTESLRRSAEAAIDEIRAAGREERSVAFVGALAVGYDDNVRLEPRDNDLFADEGDAFARLRLGATWTPVHRAALKAGLGYVHNQTVHGELNDFDLTGATGSAFLGGRWGPVGWSLSYLPSFFWLDSESYLMRHELIPRVNWRLGNALFASLGYGYHRDRFLEDPDRSGHTHRAELSGLWSPGGLVRRINVDLAYRDRSASSAIQAYEEASAAMTLSMGLPWHFVADVTGRYARREYRGKDEVTAALRADRLYEGEVRVSMPLQGEWLTLDLGFTWTENDSNVEDFSYRRRVTALSLTAAH